MTDLNMDYDYASKQRNLSQENYQRAWPLRWEAAAGVADDPYPAGSDDEVYFARIHANDTAVYQSRDGIDVCRLAIDIADGAGQRWFLFSRFSQIDLRLSWRWSGKIYMDETCWFLWGNYPYGYTGNINWLIENEPGYRGTEVQTKAFDADQIRTLENDNSGLGQSIIAGWTEFVFEWDADTLTCSGRIWNSSGADPVTMQWSKVITGSYPFPVNSAESYMQLATTGDSDEIDFAWFQIEQILP